MTSLLISGAALTVTIVCVGLMIHSVHKTRRLYQQAARDYERPAEYRRETAQIRAETDGIRAETAALQRDRLRMNRGDH